MVNENTIFRFQNRFLFISVISHAFKKRLIKLPDLAFFIYDLRLAVLLSEVGDLLHQAVRKALCGTIAATHLFFLNLALQRKIEDGCVAEAARVVTAEPENAV